MAGSIDRLKGSVKWFDSRRGFGFIAPEGGGRDLFVHQSSIKAVGFRSLTAGEIVEFVVSVGDDGRSSAVSVTGPGSACIPPLPDMGETLVGQVSESLNSEEEEERSKVSSEDSAEWRNWAELPRDILMMIFKKIAVAEILSSAQAVCRPWRQLSHEPALWRCIDLRMYDHLNDMVSMVMMVVDRSKGCLEELYIGYFSTDGLMDYIAERATRLRGLHLVSVGIDEKTLVETLRKLPLLEELEISRCYCFNYKVVERVGEACPQLKSFRLDDRVPTYPLHRRCDSRKNVNALDIAKHFKQLRRLRLFSNCLTNIGLSAILDNCPYLEYLDIRYCFNIDFLDENLKSKCTKLKDLRLPNDSTADYEYGIDEVVTEYNDYGSSDSDYDYGYNDDEYNVYGSSDSD